MFFVMQTIKYQHFFLAETKIPKQKTSILYHGYVEVVPGTDGLYSIVPILTEYPEQQIHILYLGYSEVSI